MKIPNSPEELDLAPLVEYLSEISEELTGYDRERFHPMYKQHLYWLFLEHRDPEQQESVDRLVDTLRHCYDGNLP
jgi:hypothetical protein